jgi:hypothetical protein
MNYPIYFDINFSGSGFYAPPPPPPPPPPEPPTNEIILPKFCESNGYLSDPNCYLPLQVIVDGIICYACGELEKISSSSSSEESSSSSSEVIPPNYFTDPPIFQNFKRIDINSGANIVALGFNNPNKNYSISGLSCVQIFEKSGDSLGLQSVITGNFADNNQFSNFGYSLNLNSSGDRIIIGAPDSNSAFFYEYKDSEWKNLLKIEDSLSTINQGYGHDVRINRSGDKFFVSAPNAENGGNVLFLTYKNSLFDSKLLPLFTENEDFSNSSFGASIGINNSGTILAVGAPKHNHGEGFVNIYSGELDNIQKVQTIYGDKIWTNFGNKIEVNFDGSIIYIGSPLESGLNGNIGAIYVYKKSITNTWILKQKITGDINNANFGSNFEIRNDGRYIFVPNQEFNRIDLYTGDLINNWNLYVSVTGTDCQRLPLNYFGENIALNDAGDKLISTNNHDEIFLYTTEDVKRSNPNLIFEIQDQEFGSENFTIYPISDNPSTQFTFQSSDVNVARINNEGVVSIISPGTTLISVSQEGNDCYLSGYYEQYLDVYKVDQKLDFELPQNKEFNGSDFPLPKYTDVNLPVIYSSSNSGVAIIDNYAIKFISAGSCLISGVQGGNGKYNPINIVKNLNVNKGHQFIDLKINKEYFLEDSPIQIFAKSSSDLPVTLTPLNSSIIDFDKNIATLRDIGILTVKFTQNGNNNYYSAQTRYATLCIKNKKDCFTLTNFSTPCDCGNKCRNCCGVDSSVKILNRYLNNKNNWNIDLKLDIFNLNCDNLSDFYRIYANNQLYKSNYYFAEKNSSTKELVSITDVKSYNSILNIKIEIDAFGKTYYQQLSF